MPDEKDLLVANAALDEPDATELVNRTTADTTAQLLSTEQSTSFIDLVLDGASGGLLGMIPPQNRLAMTSTAKDISRLSMPNATMAFGLADYEHMDPDQYVVPVYDKRTLTLENWDAHIALTTDQLRDNIEGPRHENSLDAALTRQLANDLEQNCWISDLTAAADPAMPDGWGVSFDGWRVLLADGNVLDGNGAGVSAAIFQELIESLPTAMQPTNGAEGFQFFCSKRVYFSWRQVLQARETALGDMQLIDGNVPAYAGVPLVPMNYIPNAVAGATGTSLSNDPGPYTYVALARPQEFFFGFKPEIERWRAPHYVDGKVIHIHLRGRIGVQIAVPEWTALAVNVSPVAA